MLDVFDHRDLPALMLLHVNHVRWTHRIAITATRTCVQVYLYNHISWFWGFVPSLIFDFLRLSQASFTVPSNAAALWPYRLKYSL